MKVSAYTVDLGLDEERSMLYNTVSREYYVYQKKQARELWNFMANMNHGIRCLENFDLFAQLQKKRIIVQEDADELCELRYLENRRRYANDSFYLKIIVTNGCNFKCTYCEETSVTMPIRDNTIDKLLKLLEEVTTKVRHLYIEWCGGEPLLEYERICRIMTQVSEICDKNSCELQAKLYTNGYLIDEKKIKRLQSVRIEELHVTIDGDEKEHNLHRKDVCAQGTYKCVIANLQSVVRAGMKLTLQIHVDENRESESFEVLEVISRKYREQVSVRFFSAPWNEKCTSVYRYVVKAMDLGYQCHERYNAYVQCRACCNNSLIVDMNGSILLCSKAKSGEQCIGYLDESGQIRIEKEHNLYKMRNITALDNETCQGCQELPLCMGDCGKVRSNDNTGCVRRAKKGLTLEEVAWLDYYSDQREKEQEEI